MSFSQRYFAPCSLHRPCTAPTLTRRATATPGGAVVSGGVPTLQVVLIEAAAQRLPCGDCNHSAASFGVDMPAPVPYGRWDWEAHASRAAAAGSRPPAHFGGFLPGEVVRRAWVDIIYFALKRALPATSLRCSERCPLSAPALCLSPAQPLQTLLPLTLACSPSQLVRPACWTRSSACCWKPRGRQQLPLVPAARAC